MKMFSSAALASSCALLVFIDAQAKQQFADLVPVSSEAPDIVDAGQSITITWQASNRGDAAAGPPWYDRIYFSTDAELGSDDQLGQTQWTTTLAAGGTYESSAQCTLPNRPPGTYYLMLVLDAYSNVYEASETNNTLVHAIRIGPAEVTQYTPIGASGYFGAQITVAGGPHTLYSLKEGPFGVIVQDPLPGTLLRPGTYTITLTIIDQLDGRQICTSKFTVQSVTGPALGCPPNLTTNATSSAGTIVNYQVNVCDSSATLRCTPPSGSLFPVGTTTVTCETKTASGATETCSFAVTVVNRPGLSASRSGDEISIGWTEGGQLQRADSIAGPWRTVPNATSPYRLRPTATERQSFFRVVP